MLGWASSTRAAWRAASGFAVPANTGEMAAYFAIQKRPPGAASSSLSQQQQNKRRTSAASSRGSCRRPHAAAAAEQAARRVRGARVVVPLPAAAERPAPPRRVGGARVVVPLPAAAAAGRPAPPRRPLTSPPFAAAVRCLFSLCRRRLFTSLSNGYFCTLLLSCWLPPPLLRPTQVPLPGLAVHAPGATDRRGCSAGCGDGGK